MSVDVTRMLRLLVYSKIFVLVLPLVFTQGLQQPTKAQVDVIKSLIKDVFESDNDLQGTALRLSR